MFDKSKLEFGKAVEGVVNATYTDKDAYYSGTDIPKETLKKVADYNSSYITKATELATAESKAKMVKDTTINKVVAEFPFGTKAHGNVVVSVDREKTFSNYPAKDDNGNPREPIKKSKVSVVVSDPVYKPSKSLLKEIEADLTEHLLK